MDNKYLDTLEKLLKHVRPKLPTTHKLKFKNCFGAIAGYINGNIFVSCGRFGVALRLPPETLAGLFKEKNASHLRYFPKGHIKKEYAVIPQQIIDNENHFKKLLDKSIKYALINNKINKIKKWNNKK